MSRQSVLKEALALPTDERLDLVMAIWDSIATGGTVPELSEEQKEELDRRAEAYRADPSRGIPADQVFDEIEREL